MRRFLLVLVVLAVSGLVFANGESEEAAGPVEADDGFMELVTEDVELRWRIDGSEIEFHVGGATTGWVAIGFNPSQAMADADYIIGYVSGTDVMVRDDFGVGMFAHNADTAIGGNDDLTLIDGEESDGFTRLRLRRPLAAGDEYDQALAAGDDIEVIWALGPDGADNFSSHHKARGSFTIRL